MPQDRRPEAAYTILESDAWYETDDGAYAVDCPECGSPATVSSIVEHGRCTAYLDREQRVTEVDESTLECSAKLWFELGYGSDTADE